MTRSFAMLLCVVAAAALALGAAGSPFLASCVGGCDDGNACTADDCDAQLGCVHEARRCVPRECSRGAAAGARDMDVLLLLEDTLRLHEGRRAAVLRGAETLIRRYSQPGAFRARLAVGSYDFHGGFLLWQDFTRRNESALAAVRAAMHEERAELETPRGAEGAPVPRDSSEAALAALEVAADAEAQCGGADPRQRCLLRDEGRALPSLLRWRGGEAVERFVLLVADQSQARRIKSRAKRAVRRNRLQDRMGALRERFLAWPTFALTMFVSHRAPRSVHDTLGDPDHDDHYQDWSNFNSKYTLDRLKHFEKINLQRRLLEAGLAARVFPFKKLMETAAPTGGAGALAHAWSEPAPRAFCDLCAVHSCDAQAGCTSAPLQCPAGASCQSGHGCLDAHGVLLDEQPWQLGQEKKKKKKKKKKKPIRVRPPPPPSTMRLSPHQLYREEVAPFIAPSLQDQQEVPLIRRSDPVFDVCAWQRARGEGGYGGSMCTVDDLFSPWMVENEYDPRYTSQVMVTRSVEEKHWQPHKPFVQMFIDRDRPLVLRNTLVESWPALARWEDLYHVRDRLGLDTMVNVKRSTQRTLFDQDWRSPMMRLSSLDRRVMYEQVNFTVDDFFDAVYNPPDEYSFYYFGEMTPDLLDDVSPDRSLYLSDYDYDRRDQYLWISSRGPCMHTHFDQDRNVFVQLHGTKKFTLFPPAAHKKMYTFPRIHPLWHKSQASFDSPDLERFPEYADLAGEGMTAVLQPGDMLYVPPYWWHHVESFTESISLSTWSRHTTVTDSMISAFSKGTRADDMRNKKPRVWALRLFLDMLISDVLGRNRVGEFVRELVHYRFAHLADLFPPCDKLRDVCQLMRVSTKTMEAVEFDVRVVGSRFAKLKAEERDINLADYVELVVEDTVGVQNVYQFFRYCFLPGQQYKLDESFMSVAEEEDHIFMKVAGVRTKMSAIQDEDVERMTPEERALWEDVTTDYLAPTDEEDISCVLPEDFRLDPSQVGVPEALRETPSPAHTHTEL